VLCENVRIAQEALPVPLAVENIAALISWPGEEMTEGQFLYELADRTGVRLLIDVANLHTNHVNRGEDPAEALADLPLEAIAYVHVAGGFERDGVWHDSHAHPVPRPVLDILTDLASRVSPPGVLLERDENFPEPAELEGELEAIRQALQKSGPNPTTPSKTPPPTEAPPAPAPAPASSAPAPPASIPPASAPPASIPSDPIPSAPRSSTPAPSTATSSASTPPTPAPPASITSAPAESAPTSSASARSTATSSAPAPASDTAPAPTGDHSRQRVALAETALLSALVAGTPVPEGFDRVRLGVQARALAAKRADIVAKVAPELPDILGPAYRRAFLAYAHGHPMTAGYRRDALDFAERVLLAGQLEDAAARRALREWWLERSGPAPRSRRPGVRLARATRRALLRR
jgi:hypothetical protein